MQYAFDELDDQQESEEESKPNALTVDSLEDTDKAIQPSEPEVPKSDPAQTGEITMTRLPVAKSSQAALMLAALGVIFGDIGTSPLYAMHAVFNLDHGLITPTQENIYGIISLVFWSITLVVTFEYLFLVMRADNDGEGGILALTALLRKTTKGTKLFGLFTFLGILGASLFYGDSIITPAISVMSAVEGLELISPSASHVVVPISLVILIVLFSIQKFGTGKVGRFFGPVMVCWFLTVALLGIPHILEHPGILAAVSPHHAVLFAVHHPVMAFVALGASVLAITGAETLYADMGHFGRKPIVRSWLFLVFPCLIINYLGQGALLVNNPKAIANPFFNLVPDVLLWPIVFIATTATVIASQAVISGAFSVTQQALNLGLVPRMRILHTSKSEGGQIFIPTINVMLMVGVATLILGFRSSEALSSAYGLAVTGTEILTMTLFASYAHMVWKWSIARLLPILIVVGGLEVLYFAANVMKIPTGGWLPIVIATTVVIIMTTWMWGSHAIHKLRAELEMPLDDWLTKIRALNLPRIPGQAIYLHQNKGTVPLALKENVRFNHTLHEQIVFVRVLVRNIPHVRHVDRVSIERIGEASDGIMSMTIQLGFNDNQNIPHNLKWSSGKDPDFVYANDEARYFLSVMDFRPSDETPWYLRWRRSLYMFLSRNAGSRMEAFRLPRHRTVIIGGSVYL
ncbi:potassium transporter Kup [Arcanobacterium ihumii]|uniref:potassium transporter Kup n=1 Tax=Arcanobacterium ihumii TaxID=2138162 RepID=UPI00190F29DE|nr:potassium transporter Kup [Arcanobacterium ihumii]